MTNSETPPPPGTRMDCAEILRLLDQLIHLVHQLAAVIREECEGDPS